jgi:hypothetical protein
LAEADEGMGFKDILLEAMLIFTFNAVSSE